MPKRSYRLRLAVAAFRPSGVAPPRLQLYLNNDPVDLAIQLPEMAPVVLRHTIPCTSVHDEQMILRIESTAFTPASFGGSDSRALGVALFEADVYESGAIGRNRQQFQPPTPISRLPEGWTVRSCTEDELDRYQLLFANSYYTQRWIQERWKRPSRVLYPLIPVEQFAPRAKKPQLISVGRFFRGSHNKKHIPMLQAFRKLCDVGLTGWHYHVVGGTHEEPEHQDYLGEVHAAAEGYPITIHTDIDFQTLRMLYGESRIYWNATGWGEDEQTMPEAFEHFGITTVEAMASGCVPVSFARAGQPEIIEQGISGFLWTDFRECEAFTRQLMVDDQQWRRMSEAALERSRCFAEDAFEESLARHLDWLLGRHADGNVLLPERLAFTPAPVREAVSRRRDRFRHQ